jgi:tight adherence protein B
MIRRGRGIALTGVLAAGVLVLLATPSSAATTGHIAGQDYADGTLRIIFQASDLEKDATIDPESVRLTVGGNRLPIQDVSPLSATPLTRTAVLAFDNSRSMRPRLAAAKAAADVFLTELPADVKVGLVTFGETATEDVAPTADHGLVRSRVDALKVDATKGTALYDGVRVAVQTAGSEGARSVLMLTDGDEVRSSSSLSEAVAAVTRSGATFDAVYIGPSPTTPPDLSDLVAGVRGQVLDSDPADLAKVFAVAARAISSQVQITVKVPARFTGKTADVAITATAGAVTIFDQASYDFPKPTSKPGKFGPQAVQLSAPLVSDSLLPVAIGALFVGLLVVLCLAFTVADVGDRKQTRIRRRLSLYTVTGRPTAASAETTTALGNSQVARSAVELAGRVVQRRDFEGDLSRRLESAGVPLRAAEWMLIHIGVALGLSFFLLLVSGGAILPTIVGLVLGLAAPWLYLSFKESRRTSAFLGQLPDTLQLIAGSLSAGYAIAQAIDTVVREGQQPITGEFNRALVEARLGVPIEDALAGVATRMQSKDFAWVVMAIRIQREVGGNLAELLTTVSGTLRERERLRRQVKVLSAEGRLSAWILGLLPPGFSLYLLLARPEYLRPLVTDPLGWLMLSVGALLLVVGAGWMIKAVKVEV